MLTLELIDTSPLGGILFTVSAFTVIVVWLGAISMGFECFSLRIRWIRCVVGLYEPPSSLARSDWILITGAPLLEVLHLFYSPVSKGLPSSCAFSLSCERTGLD